MPAVARHGVPEHLQLDHGQHNEAEGEKIRSDFSNLNTIKYLGVLRRVYAEMHSECKDGRHDTTFAVKIHSRNAGRCV